MSILTRVRALNLPTDQIIVIGSGLLDAYGLRRAGDIDLVVTSELFTKLSSTGQYKQEEKNGEAYLVKDNLEVWLDWGGGHDFTKLQNEGVVIEGITFVNPLFLIERKRERGTDKDKQDIALLEGYLREQR